MSDLKEYLLKIDKKVNPWIKNYTCSVNNDNYLNTLLSIGNDVMNNIKLTSDSKYIDEKIDFINQFNKKERELIDLNTKSSINTINSSLQNLSEILKNSCDTTNQTIKESSDKTFNTLMEVVGKTNISAHKGQIGENYILNTAQKFYPDAIIESNVAKAQEADICFKLKDYPSILIESKNYTNPVPYKEVNKFKNDLVNKNCKFGIFLSFNQKIQSMYDKLFIEKYNDITILYASNLEFCKSDIILPIEFILYISQFDTEYQINTRDLNRKADQISLTIEDLENLHNLYRINLNNIQDQAKIIDDSLSKIRESVLRNQIESANLINDIKDKISQEIGEFFSKKHEYQELSFDSLEGKNKDLMMLIDKTLPDYLSMKLLDEEFFIIDDNSKALAKFTIGKTRVKGTILSSNGVFTLDNQNLFDFIKYLSI